MIRLKKMAFFIFSLFIIANCTGSGNIVSKENKWENYRANALFERAEAYYNAQRYAEAINDYTEYLANYKDMFKADDASMRIAQCLEALGQRVEAADIYRATALAWYKSTLAPYAFLREGELYEIEGWLRDAKIDYDRAAEYVNTEPGKIAFERLQNVKKKIEEEERLRRERRRSGKDVALVEDISKTSNLRELPPADRTLYDLIMRR